MRPMPHEPNADLLSAASERVRRCLDRLAGRREEERKLRNARFFRTLADQWILRGMVEYGEDRPLAEVAASLRRGVLEIRTFFELAASATPWDAWDCLLFALAVGDRPTADFIRRIPEPTWGRLTSMALGWLVMQVRTVSALLGGEETAIARALRDLQVAVLEIPLPDGLGEDAAEVVNGVQLLHAVYRKDEVAFRRVVGERMDLRERSFRRHGRNTPLGFLDLHTLGICRIAKDRGMKIALQHAYLPLGLLDLS